MVSRPARRAAGDRRRLARQPRLRRPLRACGSGVATVDASWRVGAGSGQYAEKEPGALERAHRRPRRPVPPLDHPAPELRRAVPSRLPGPRRRGRGRQPGRPGEERQLPRPGPAHPTGRPDPRRGPLGHRLRAARPHGVPQPLVALPHDLGRRRVAPSRTSIDLRAFEYHARQMAAAVEQAAADLRPARMGATTVEHRIYKGNIAGATTADDGTPAGYPDDHADFGLTVLRFDDVSGPTPTPLAVFVNHGQHPESLDALRPHQRRLPGPAAAHGRAETSGRRSCSARATSARPRVPTCGRTPRSCPTASCGRGRTSATPRPSGAPATSPTASIEAWDGHRSGRRARAVQPGRPGRDADRPRAQARCRTLTRACRTAGPRPTVEGDPGVPVLGLPDCERPGEAVPSPLTWDDLKALGLPVPEHYDAPAVGVVEENARLKLQVVRLGEVLLASCACEPQMDLVRNLESRIDDVAGNIDNGFDWSSRCTARPRAPGPARSATGRRGARRPRWPDAGPGAQRRRGLGRPANVLCGQRRAGRPDGRSRATSPTRSCPPDLGYRLPIALGHSVGLQRLHGLVPRVHGPRPLPQGAHELRPAHRRLHEHDAGGAWPAPSRAARPARRRCSTRSRRRDEARQARSPQPPSALRRRRPSTRGMAALPDDVGPPAPLAQPEDITRFAAATFTWRGGSTRGRQPDRPGRAPGRWGMVDLRRPVAARCRRWWPCPTGLPGTVDAWTGSHEWRWTAAFEAFDAFPAPVVSTAARCPTGTYRFVVDGRPAGPAARTARTTWRPTPFRVEPWTGVTASDARLEPDGSVSLHAPARPTPAPMRHRSAT